MLFFLCPIQEPAAMSDPLPASADGRAASRDLRRLRVLAAVQEGLSYAAIGPRGRTVARAGAADRRPGAG